MDVTKSFVDPETYNLREVRTQKLLGRMRVTLYQVSSNKLVIRGEFGTSNGLGLDSTISLFLCREQEDFDDLYVRPLSYHTFHNTVFTRSTIPCRLTPD